MLVMWFFDIQQTKSAHETSRPPYGLTALAESICDVSITDELFEPARGDRLSTTLATF